MLHGQSHLFLEKAFLITLVVFGLMADGFLQSQEAVPSILLKKLPPAKSESGNEKSLIQLLQAGRTQRKGAIFKASGTKSSSDQTGYSLRPNRVQSDRSSNQSDEKPFAQSSKPQNLEPFLIRIGTKTMEEAGPEKTGDPSLEEKSLTDLTLAIETRKRDSSFVESAPAIAPVESNQLEKLTRKDKAFGKAKATPGEEFLELPPAL